MSQKENIDQPRMVELSKETQRRIERFKVFEEFFSKAKEIFEPFKDRGEREQYFQALYMLNVVPGSRSGGQDSNIVDIFWGRRIFDKEEGIENNKRRTKFKSEKGATLFIFKNDDGYVSIRLYPAVTDSNRPTEDFIIWKSHIQPSRLLNKYFQKYCWLTFMSYMEVTSLDGNPSLWQKIYIWYLRNFKSLIIDNKLKPVGFYSFLRKVGTWVLTVAFSGLAIFLLQLWFQQNPAEHANIKTIIESSEQTTDILNKIDIEVEQIRDTQDSILDLFNYKTSSDSDKHINQK